MTAVAAGRLGFAFGAVGAVARAAAVGDLFVGAAHVAVLVTGRRGAAGAGFGLAIVGLMARFAVLMALGGRAALLVVARSTGGARAARVVRGIVVTARAVGVALGDADRGYIADRLFVAVATESSAMRIPANPAAGTARWINGDRGQFTRKSDFADRGNARKTT